MTMKTTDTPLSLDARPKADAPSHTSPKLARKDEPTGTLRARIPADYLGPARVTRLLTPCVEVRMPGGETRLANMALAYPYQPAENDVLLIAASGDDVYVIGVVAGHGQTCLEFQGDVSLRAVGGSVDISADEGVRLSAPKMEFAAKTIKTLAGAVSQTFNTCYTRVRELMSTQAGEKRDVVEGYWFFSADRAQINTNNTIGINGREVHLG